MNATDVTALHGKVVLVCSAQDTRNPPTGRRGTIVVTPDTADGSPAVDVEIDFPQMFTRSAHLRRVRLSEAQVSHMLESEHYGTFTVMLEDRLDPEAEPGNQ